MALVSAYMAKLFGRKVRFGAVRSARMPDVSVLLKNCLFFADTGAVFIQDAALDFYGPSAFLPSKEGTIIQLSRYLRLRRIDLATTIAHGPWNNYYHWYVDSVPRLWGLQHSVVATLGKIVLPITRRLSTDEMRLLKCLLPVNVEVRTVSRYAVYKADTFLFLPFLSGDRSGGLPGEYLKFYREKVFKEFGINYTHRKRRIFISRRASPKRSFTNQDEVENYLEAQGFMCLQLERLSIRQQIDAFSNACIVIGSHGAGLTNLLYASSCEVVEIFHSQHEADLNHYRDLARSLNLCYSSIILKGKSKDENVQLPLELIAEKLKSLTLF